MLHALRKNVLTLAVAAVAAGLLVGCEVGSYPLDIFPEMHYQESYRTQEPPMVPTPQGSVPTTGKEIPPNLGQALAAANPLAGDADAVTAGKHLFYVNCSACHGLAGDGVSPVAQKYADAGGRAPPSLVAPDSAAVASADGFLYGIVTNGIGNMPGLWKILTPDERWAIITYLRTIQAP
jgi:mono/diheme cytochrome c family protein